MKINKVLILGIDALEYNLVEKWNLKNLKQEEYGKTELPSSVKATVIMWPCFITGFPPSEMGYTTIRIYKEPLQHLYEIVYSLIFKMHLRIKKRAENKAEVDKNLVTLIRKILGEKASKLGLCRMPERKDIKRRSIFEIPHIRAIHLNIPVYDTDAFPPNRRNILEAIEKKVCRPIFEMQCIQEFNQRTKELLDWLDKKNEWDLVMQYFWLLDGIQHVFYNQPKKIAKFYIMFDGFIEKVRKKIDDDTLLLIVSDHGQKKGMHTDYGFYSLNKPLGLKNPKFIDFKWIIEELLKKRERE